MQPARMIASTVAALLAAACLPVLGANPAPAPAMHAFTAPKTPQRPVTDHYGAVSVTDPYRWLENWDDPEVKKWSEAQNAAARAYLDSLPNVEAIRARITALESGVSVSYAGLQCRTDPGSAPVLFALKNQPPKQQPMLVRMGLDEKGQPAPAKEFVIADPNEMDKSGGIEIDWFQASRDGKLVAVSMSKGGSEAGDVHVFDAATGKETDVVIPRVNGGTAGGSLAWKGDGSGFFYTRYPRGKERAAEDMDFYTQVYFHKLGTPTEQDKYEAGKDFPRIGEIMLEASPSGNMVLASVQKGDGGEFQHYLRGPGGEWTQLTTYKDMCVFGTLSDNAVFLVSTKNAPRGKMLKLPLGDTTPSIDGATLIVPEGDNAIQSNFAERQGAWATKDALYVLYQTGGPTELRAFDLNGKALGTLPAQPVSDIDSVCTLGGGDILFRSESYLAPAAWYAYDAAKRSAAKTALFTTSPADYADSEVVREWATSKDGTKVPMTILRRKGAKLDGNNPLLLWGYGGYGVCETPAFSSRVRIWLDQGGVFVCANIRGGGEFGEDWHHQGSLLNKQNVFDDYAACAQRLIELKYTRHDKLAFRGGSNGGLLMGAEITQHPELPRAVVSHVGIYDMLRVELTPNGAFNVPEFGTVKDPALFQAMYAYSPYHHVTDGVAYPAVLFTTGANDPRVTPWHSRKMVARLQAATSSGLPILLRTSANAGHGIGSSLSERIEENVDMYAFLFAQLGIDYKAVK